MAVPARHFSARTPWDRNRTLWAGYVLRHPNWGEGSLYFAGDTGFGDGLHFRQIGNRFGPIRLALLPIGAYRPRWFMQPIHMDPAEAVRAHQELAAESSIAMHWGTFQLTEEGIDKPVEDLRAALRAAGEPPPDFRVLEHGDASCL